MQLVYSVYMHLNKSNSKKYIGISSDIAKRWRSSGSGYNSNKHFYAAIKKYGWELGFTHLIIAAHLDFETALQLEKYYIKMYDTTNPHYGYNISKGGLGYCRYSTEEEKNVAHKIAVKKSKLKRKSCKEKADLDREINRNNYHKHMQDSAYAQQRRDNARITSNLLYNTDEHFKARVNKNSKEYYTRITSIRNELRKLYNQNKVHFSEDEYRVAFGFNDKGKNYVCQSAKKLQNLLTKKRGEL